MLGQKVELDEDSSRSHLIGLQCILLCESVQETDLNAFF